MSPELHVTTRNTLASSWIRGGGSPQKRAGWKPSSPGDWSVRQRVCREVLVRQQPGIVASQVWHQLRQPVQRRLAARLRCLILRLQLLHMMPLGSRWDLPVHREPSGSLHTAAFKTA